MNKLYNLKENWMNFRNSALKIETWVQKAKELKEAIDIFRQYHHLQQLVILKKINLPSEISDFYKKGSFTYQTQRMLMGFSFENVLKGILVARNPDKYLPEDQTKFVIKSGHNLPKLCKECGINLEKIEENYFKMLSAYSEWGGRYPIGRHQNIIPVERKPKNINGIEISTISLYFGNQDNDYFDEERWYDIYHTSIQEFEYGFYEKMFQKILTIAEEIISSI